MAEILKTMYGGVEIEYQERADQWRFELRGRERFASSLTAAKEAIDKPAPKAKKQFERVKAYKKGSRMFGDGDEPFITVEITSIAEPDRYSRKTQVWISNNGKREKVELESLYAVTPENEALIAEIAALEQQLSNLRDLRDAKRNSMSHPVVEAGEEL